MDRELNTTLQPCTLSIPNHYNRLFPAWKPPPGTSVLCRSDFGIVRHGSSPDVTCLDIR